MVRQWVKTNALVNLIGATADDARDIMIEGESGILAICPPAERPAYLPSKRQLAWPNGAKSLIFTADEPDRLRGKQHMKLCCDEVASWRYAESWDQAMMGLRLGVLPQAVVTTTPKPTSIIRTLAEDNRNAITRGTTYDNRANLAPTFYSRVITKYEGTRLGRQELNAELLEDNPSALWQRARLDALRVTKAPKLRRVVVAIDPEATSGEKSAETGIIVAGVGDDGHGYVLDDRSLRASPHMWATAAVTAYHVYKGDRIVAEVNNGGEMVEHTIRTVDDTVPYTALHASRGKHVRAEPVAALYEQCLAPGTMVDTARGPVPIEEITTDDLVWTRRGLRRVRWSGQTGISETIKIRGEGLELVCTANHPIHTTRGFIQAGLLVPTCDILTAWESLHVQTAASRSRNLADGANHAQLSIVGQHRANQFDHSSHSRAPDISSRQTDTIAQDATTAAICFTEMYGKQPMGLSLMVGMFITGMATQRIMSLKTSFRLSLKGMRASMIMRPRGLRMFEHQQERREKHGGDADNLARISARNVGASFSPRLHEFDSVLLPATRRIGLGSVEGSTKTPVYNLEVSGEPEFFANGILVHNCRVHHVGTFGELEDQLCQWTPGDTSPDRLDALVWALTELMLDGAALPFGWMTEVQG